MLVQRKMSSYKSFDINQHYWSMNAVCTVSYLLNCSTAMLFLQMQFRFNRLIINKVSDKLRHIQGGPKKRILSFIFGITSVIQHRF